MHLASVFIVVLIQRLLGKESPSGKNLKALRLPGASAQKDPEPPDRFTAELSAGL
jgi:hypothetical protein